MDLKLRKEYEKAINKKCNICNKIITEKDLDINNVIATITKKKQAQFVHTTCLFRR